MSSLVTQIGRLRSLLRRRGQRREDAEDLVQEAFLRLQVYCNEGNVVRSPDAFLARTAFNLAVNARQARHSHLYVSDAVEDLPLVDLGPGPEEVLAAEQCLQKLTAILDEQSRRTREIFFMHRLHGLSYAQIAEHFDVSVSAVEKHIAKAMAVLGPQMYREMQRS